MLKTHLETGRKVLKILIDHGHLAYFVGGFVRDFLLDIKSSDIDITTSALPEETMAYFAKTRPTGLKYGTITVFLDGLEFEVTTFRSDGFYSNNRHPEVVRFSKSLEEDLKRRDFTINALAMDIDGKITDLFGGIEDLNSKKIKAIGVPEDRFKEDSLRILRSFRFVSKCNFDIDLKTFQSIINTHHLLKNISNERIIQEFAKIISYPNSTKAFQLIEKSHVTDSIPDLKEGIQFLSTNKHPKLNELQFFSLAFYLHSGNVGLDWRFSNKQKQAMQTVINLCTVTQEDTFTIMHIYSLGMDICLIANDINRILNPQNDQERQIRQMDSHLPIRKTCDLTFKGQDIIELTNLKNAEIIGDIIDDLIFQVITNQLKNDYDILKTYTLQTYFNR